MVKLNKINVIVSMALASTLMLSGCARQLSSNVYSAVHVGEVSKTAKGVIVGLRQVRVDSADLLEENGLGLIGGGVIGGLLGSTLGKGTGRIAAVGLGAILGAVGGTILERQMKAQMAIEYVVKTSDGSMNTVVQAPEPMLAVGQQVLVMTSHKGRSRLVADTTIPVSLNVR